MINMLLCRYVFLDNGEEVHMELKENKSSLVTFKAHVENGNGVLKSHVKHGEFALQEGWIIDHVVVLGGGVDTAAASSFAVSLNGDVIKVDSNVSQVISHEGSKLHISALGLPLGTPFELKWTSH